MKFSCPSCSAKYQISDDKVEGRTVKMKCRKCGTVIPIRAEPSHRELAAAPVVHAQSLKPSQQSLAAKPGGYGLSASRLPVIEAPAPPSIPTQPPPSEWHAGIDGSAVGPLTFQELQRHIMDGTITADTFIWRDGMDGWKQVPDVPEVAPLLEAIELEGPPSMPAVAKAQRKGGVVVPAPTVPKPLGPPKPSISAKAPAASPLLGSRGGPASPVKQLAVSPVINEIAQPNLIPSLQAPPDNTRAGDHPSVPAVASVKPVGPDHEDEFAFPPAAARKPLPESGLVAAGVAGTQTKISDAPAPDVALQGEGPYVANHQPSYDSLVMQLHKKRSNRWAIPFTVVAALGLGLTFGFVLFGDQETKIIRQIVEVPAEISEAKQRKSDLAEDLSAAATPEVVDDAATRTQPGKSTGAKPGATSAASAKDAEKVAEGLKGLSGLQGLDGPSSGPSASTAAAGGKPLESAQIQRVVTQYQTSVKRGCWQPALMSRDKDAPSSARVTVSITVAGSGAVTNATTGGDPKGYSGLSTCISQKVRGWTFPRSSGTTTVNVPFVFAAQ